MKIIRHIRDRAAVITAFALVAAMTAPAYAAGSALACEQPLQELLALAQSPAVKITSLFVFVIAALLVGFGNSSETILITTRPTLVVGERFIGSYQLIWTVFILAFAVFFGSFLLSVFHTDPGPLGLGLPVFPPAGEP